MQSSVAMNGIGGGDERRTEQLDSGFLGKIRKVPADLVASAKSVQSVVRGIEPWGISIAVLAFGATLIGMMIELEDRQSERIFRAWDVVLKSNEGRASGGSARQAMEYLNRKFEGWGCGEPVRYASITFTGLASRECLIPKKRSEILIALNLQKVNLDFAQLPGAVLSRVNLSNSSLQYANFANALLDGANFAYGKLNGINFHDANLERANLRGANLNHSGFEFSSFDQIGFKTSNLKFANLIKANLSDATFNGANFQGADLTNANINRAVLGEARGLHQRMIDAACGSEAPASLPAGLVWHSKECPK